ncbi:putative anthocyanidin reductase isoform X2 [Cryptomeria japonica]|uniref:putative anthocyanidin reductase isoform X2 n=1 Tax=Cryptomeria japonica TaxID=3369 RepID=UPI0027DAA2FE|nr:putative anthocyanidin reductase isoform X2 [Cryptomeria japonica]
MASGGKNGVRVVCVTGAGGYIASWLVKNLLESGYTEHATLRDPGDERKCGPVLNLPGAQERLKLFQTDLLEEGSFDSAVEGCQGVFHLASPVAGDKENTPEDYIVAAVNGVLNVMRACTKAKSVRRVVYTSSLSAACPLSDKGELASSCLDESCWSPIDFLRSHTNKLAWYMAAKTLAEQEALKYGTHNEIEVVTILPPIVLGPWFTETPGFSSSQTVLSLIKGCDLPIHSLSWADTLHTWEPHKLT